MYFKKAFYLCIIKFNHHIKTLEIMRTHKAGTNLYSTVLNRTVTVACFDNASGLYHVVATHTPTFGVKKGQLKEINVLLTASPTQLIKRRA